MKKILFVAFITIASASISIGIAFIPNPTDAQTAIATAGATIATTGATTLIGAIGNPKKDDEDDKDED